MLGRFVCVLVCLSALAAAEQQSVNGAKDALVNALKAIGERIEATAADDQQQQTAIQTKCEADQKIIDGWISDKKDEITAKEQDIANTETLITELEGQIEANRIAFNKATATKLEKEQEIVDGDDQRAKEAATYKQYDADTDVAISAVTEVQEIVADSKLGAGEDETADDYANTTLRATSDADYSKAGQEGTASDFDEAKMANEGVSKDSDEEAPSLLSTKTSHLLRKLSNRLNDPNVKSFIEMAALSASALQGDVSRLNKLLEDLLVELKDYKTTLKEQEDQAIADWQAARATLVDEIDLLTKEIAKLEADYKILVGKKEAAEALLEKYKNELLVLQKELKDLEAQKAELTKMCKDELDAFNERTKRREEETDTLAAIKKVIDEKLGLMSDNSDAGIGYTAVDGFRWSIGDWEGVECVNRMQTRPTYCVNTETGEETQDAWQCGPKPSSIRRSCRNDIPQDDYFF